MDKSYCHLPSRGGFPQNSRDSCQKEDDILTDEKTTQTVINMGSWTTKTVIYVVLTALMIGGGGGGYLVHKWQTCPTLECLVIPALQVQPQAVTGSAAVQSDISVKPITTLGKDSTVQMKTSYGFKVDVTEIVKD